MKLKQLEKDLFVLTIGKDDILFYPVDGRIKMSYSMRLDIPTGNGIKTVIFTRRPVVLGKRTAKAFAQFLMKHSQCKNPRKK